MPRPRERYGRHAYVRQQERLAHLLGLDEETVRKYLRAGMPGADARGWYCVPRCFEWVVVELGDGRLPGTRDPVIVELTRERLRKQKLENDAREGNLATLDELKAWWEAHVARRIRESVIHLDRRFGPDAGDVIRRALREANEEMHADDPREG